MAAYAPTANSVSTSSLIGVWGPVRLRRVLDNLLSNAIKYSPQGGDVVVSVDIEETDAGSEARLKVADQGVGIPAVDLPHVFERFRRARNVVGRIAEPASDFAESARSFRTMADALTSKAREAPGHLHRSPPIGDSSVAAQRGERRRSKPGLKSAACPGASRSCEGTDR